MELPEITIIPIVLIACLAVGYVIKNTKVLDNKLNGIIPLILFILGAILGCVANQSITLENLVYGAISGLASTGLHQAFTRALNLSKTQESEE